jgi:hypothetical protein
MTQKRIVYRISCEWDTDLTNLLWETREAAMRELEAYDWISLVEEDLKSLMQANLIQVREEKVYE